MKKGLILGLLALGLAGCISYVEDTGPAVLIYKSGQTAYCDRLRRHTEAGDVIGFTCFQKDGFFRARAEHVGGIKYLGREAPGWVRVES